MRINILRNLNIAILIALILRIGYISVFQGEKYTKEAMNQRTQEIVIKKPRGIIYDRNMIKITDTKMKLVDVEGVRPFFVSTRYNDGLLSHLVGYISDEGGFGIEKAFDELLKKKESDTVSVIKDARSNVIEGIGYKKTEGKVYSGIKLSIDYHVQKLTEKAMDNGKINGAAIVVDVKSGDILAMASRPNFKQDDIAEYLNSNNGELLNRAVFAYNVGSVFKVLIASAALESGFTHEMMFHCSGKTDINGREFVCNKEEGHGDITLEQGLALSCNTVFYEVGNAIGIKKISGYAKAFGFGQEVLNINGLYEAKGNIPSDLKATPQEIANISIGQGDVMVTPLQVADMICTVVNEGTRKQLTLIKSMVDENGEHSDVKPVTLGEVISKDTARVVKNMLVCTVKYGTGTSANITNYSAGGKTGSAETGWLKNGETMTHGWFAGIFPQQNPQYVCVVLAENGKTGAASAVPVFKEIGEGIKNVLKY